MYLRRGTEEHVLVVERKKTFCCGKKQKKLGMLNKSPNRDAPKLENRDKGLCEHKEGGKWRRARAGAAKTRQ
jgi:hypothetical protein